MSGVNHGESRGDSKHCQCPGDAEKTLDRVTDAFFALNGDWEFTYLNSGTTNLLNRPDTGLVGKNIWEEFPEAMNHAFKPRFQTAIETQTPIHFDDYYPPLETWFGVHAYPSETGLSVYFRDITAEKRYTERMTRIHEASRQLIHTETLEDIADIAVESANDILGFPAVAFYYWDDKTGVLEPAAVTDAIAERYDYDMPTLSGNESVMWDVFVAGETRVYDESQPPCDDMYNPDSSIQSQIFIPVDDHGVFLAGTEIRGEIVDESVELLEILVDNVAAALDRAERERSLSEKEEQLQRTNEQLSKLKRINGIIREIDQTLIQATQQSEIETAVCEKLADVDAYQLAWFGKPDPETDEITVQASVGDNPTYLDYLLTAQRDDRQPVPVENAIQMDDAIFTENILDESSQEQWRKEALDTGYRSIASIPIQFHEVTYGVLEIYADHPNAFSDEERTVLRELGEVIGNALNAIDRKEALLADTYVELTFRLSESESVVSRVATDIDCELTVESLLPRSDDTWLVYFTAATGDPEAVLETAGQYLAVDNIEHIRSANSGNFFGLTLTELPGLDFLAEQGATITSIEANPTESEVTVEVPQSVHVRSFIQTYKARYPSAELVSRQQVSEENSGTSNDQLIGELTDQQRTALEAALEGGFFAWPRDKTGEDVAESLGVSAPTFHRHLRVGLEKIVSKVLG